MSRSYPLLDQIVQPKDLHGLSTDQLQQLAKEVRQALIDKVSQTGGHFSSNLGTVELTVALYAAYQLPPDIVVWDTGHQAYPHKLLTGRLPRFETLRKHRGLSGFLKREEHELDAFGAGHAGTSISAALGYALARDAAGEKHRVVAVTGDASIGAGMSWEALIHAGGIGADLTIVLNDNRMSIAPNVGALTTYFNKLRSRPVVQDIAHRAKDLVEKFPSPVSRVAAGLRHGVTHYFAPEDTGTVFEEMGFEYIGPVDGHDIPAMLEIFRNIRKVRGPVFIHALTVKGKGYEVAEEDARTWHGVVPFDQDACELPQGGGGPTKYTSAFGAAMCELASEDPHVVAITAAMPDGTGLNKFAEQFPQQYHDVGIAEQHAVTFAAGLAAGGQKPFCAIYSTFMQRGFDQVLHDVAIQKLPVRIVMDRAGLVGADGPTHHGTFDISFLNLIPGVAQIAPRDTTELREMIRFMASYDEGPISIRYPRGATDPVLPEGRSAISFQKAENLGVPGDAGKPRVSILAVGSMVATAWHAARALADEGTFVEVINARWIAPFDEDAIRQAADRTGHLIVMEENVRRGGFGQQVRDYLVENGLGYIPHQLMALPDRFIEHGGQEVLLAENGLGVEDVKSAVASLLRGRRSIN